jgi:ribosomal protein S18 acetylase RimI-like enzyme
MAGPETIVDQMTFLVREGRPEDIPHFVRFLMAQAMESEGMALNRETLEQGVTRVFQEPGLGRYWVIEDTETNTPAGMCMITQEWSDWHNRFYWWYQSVFISPEYRGQGLLGLMMRRIEEVAREQGVQELRLYVETENQRAIRAYDKLGYETGHYNVMQKRM